MSTERLHQIADELREEIGLKLRVSGKDLKVRLRRAGRAMPRRLRGEIWYLLDAIKLAKNPRFVPRIDMPRIERARDDVKYYLQKIDPTAWRRAYIFSIIFNTGLAVFAGGVLLIIAMRWLSLV